MSKKKIGPKYFPVSLGKVYLDFKKNIMKNMVNKDKKRVFIKG